MVTAREPGRGLVVCRTLELVALAVWVGGLVAIVGAVIPAVFNSFGMEPGGRFLTRVFDGYNRLTTAAIVVLAGTTGWRVRQSQHASVDEPSAGQVQRTEGLLLTVMILIAGLIILVLGPSSVMLQEQAFAAQGEAAKKAAYDAFFRTHMIVRALYVVNLGLGIALLAVKAARWTNAQQAAT
ncbi:MAG: DUF4149 domain-containing protein [Nitrospirae bacterium]|nr:MAG: DUF4149 domain-containing protein [Nitrospirota bacterium]